MSRCCLETNGVSVRTPGCAFRVPKFLGFGMTSTVWMCVCVCSYLCLLVGSVWSIETLTKTNTVYGVQHGIIARLLHNIKWLPCNHIYINMFMLNQMLL